MTPDCPVVIDFSFLVPCTLIIVIGVVACVEQWARVQKARIKGGEQ